jgi:hypothetical protein
MKISFESKGDFSNMEKWLNKVVKTNMESPLNQLGAQGTKSLSSHTPMDTGETASGWQSDVIKRGEVSEVVWTNTAHPESRVNVAKLIELGHGTGTGGYVPPKPYIKNAMTPVWSKVDGVVKELIR